MSKLYEYIKMAVHNIMANKGRSFLTMLGIIIGIASVIAIVSVGEGTKNQMNSEIDDIGGGQIAISVSDEAQTDEEWITADDVEAEYYFCKKARWKNRYWKSCMENSES